MVSAQSENLSFKIDPEFVAQYKNRPVKWGFKPLGEMAYLRSYSRVKPDGTKEVWWETVERVINGTFSIQKDHINSEGLEWKEYKGQRLAKRMYDAIFNFRFLPPGRGLYAMGTDVVHVKGVAAALQNCAFVSTENIVKNPTLPFTFMLDASCCGVGVGFDTKGAGKLLIHKPKDAYVFQIPDSREGWVESVKRLIDAYTSPHLKMPVFDYSLIRPAGMPLKTFGGVSSGPGPLIELHLKMVEILNGAVGQTLSTTNIADIMNLIGKCVVAGGIRRTAQIMFGEIHDDEYVNLKNYEKNPQRAAWGWASNNSVFADLGDDYDQAAEATRVNGEPGFVWMDNVRAYGRMGDPKNYKDSKAKGLNPCSEQPLEHMELCTLVETYPAHHETLNEYLDTLEMAYLYGKTVTLLKTHWPETNRVMKRNRRIGTSMSGITQFLEVNGHQALIEWMEVGYEHIQKQDERYSNWFGIARSIKTTTVKPSGTVSLLAGSTPGIHYPHSQYYIRRMRLANTSDMIPALKAAGYTVVPAAEDPTYTSVVEIPVNCGVSKGVSDVSMWEQLALTALLQKHWSDNAVSVTVTFDPVTEGPQIQAALEYYQYQLKTVSFLPRTEGVYAQMPYEAITKEKFEELNRNLKPIDWNVKTEATSDKFCDGDKCVL